MIRRIALAAVLGASIPVGSAAAHDLAETSATLIVRDGGHLELRLQVPWAEVLRDRWMHGTAMPDFLARVTSRPAAEFARDVAVVMRGIEQGVRLRSDRGRVVSFVRWQWPTGSEIQAALRKELMSRLALGNRFEHASRLGGAAEVRLGPAPEAVQLELPPWLGPALLTVSRPAEEWLRPGQPSGPIRISR